MTSLTSGFLLLMAQIYQPIDEEEVKEEVEVSEDSKEFKMREYEKAALRLTKAKLVCSLNFSAFHH